ncbi:MAG: acyl-CoA dehydrogenase family protein [Candidatus Melainabacteria bacterium]|nr:acyl-CoA dehydrogenase family protein [Candidatus Melainabacteria bacterium]
MTSDKNSNSDVSFAETALRLSGKTEEESRRTGAIDRADDEVESLFAEKYKTSNSPIHKAVWEDKIPFDLFRAEKVPQEKLNLQSMQRSIDVLKKHKRENTMYGPDGKIPENVLGDLADAGYWGMLIDKKYGGEGCSVQQFMTFISRIAAIEPTAAGLASVHGCIGAVDPVRSFGNEEQKKQFLPKLASGKALSAFALTEPGAGSDLTALKTTATLSGDKWLINGEKVFITNAIPGRTIGIVCLIDGKPAALIADLPETETENFKIVKYGLHALKHAHNLGLVFKDFAVPKENLLKPPLGDGLTVAYHGLNLGRLALCATATGVMRVMLANMLPWSHFRETYGHAVEVRELIKRRIARAAALTTGAEALYSWGAWLLDQGYRGELECIIAKIFGSEAEKECAIELFMKTHGGRSFVHGHLFGDNVHDFLAPCIYEGEGEMLGMAFFKALAKNHGQKFMEPVGRALQREGLRKLNAINPAHVWKLRNEIFPYAFWRLGKQFAAPDTYEGLGLGPALKSHVDFAIEILEQSPIELSDAMTKHQLKLADRQCRIAEMSQRIQDAITMLVTCFWAHQQQNLCVEMSADILCQDLRRKLAGERPTDSYFKACSQLADMIIDGQFPGLSEIERSDIIFSYNKPEKKREQTKV